MVKFQNFYLVLIKRWWNISISIYLLTSKYLCFGELPQKCTIRKGIPPCKESPCWTTGPLYRTRLFLFFFQPSALDQHCSCRQYWLMLAYFKYCLPQLNSNINKDINNFWEAIFLSFAIIMIRFIIECFSWTCITAQRNTLYWTWDLKFLCPLFISTT